MTATLYLVRHAKAGERRLWTGDDVDRPLSKTGRKQADLVGRRLAERGAAVLWSSPYVRCVETLEPLGRLLDLAVTVEPRLAEDEPFEPVLELLADAPNGTVMCSHGDIIPATLAALERRGAEIRTPPDWRKASVWVLGRDKKSKIVHARVWPPPIG
jgi:8-oxo-dGTP diphosphatase